MVDHVESTITHLSHLLLLLLLLQLLLLILLLLLLLRFSLRLSLRRRGGVSRVAIPPLVRVKGGLVVVVVISPTTRGLHSFTLELKLSNSRTLVHVRAQVEQLQDTLMS